jgi:hypothetical protein
MKVIADLMKNAFKWYFNTTARLYDSELYHFE